MQCDGEKTYVTDGSCPVCGMNLEIIPELSFSKFSYTCPIHPEIIKKEPGSCPICGMNLVPIEPTDSQENKTYNDLLHNPNNSYVFVMKSQNINRIGKHRNFLAKEL